MNLKQLVQAQHQLVSQRRDESDMLCRQAYYLIAEAEAEGFQNKDLLKQAMRLFVQASRQQRQEPEPYMGLLYLCLLINEETLAERYLEAVLTLAPDHADALKLKRYLEEAPEADEVLHFAWQGQDLPADQLYDAVEQSLFYLVREIMDWPAPLSAELSAQQLQDTFLSLKQALQQFEAAFSSLDQVFDTASLRRRLQPVEKISSAFGQAIEQFAELQQVQSTLNQLLVAVCQGFQQRLQRQLSSEAVEQALEQWLDQFDNSLQRVAELEQQGHEVAEQRHLGNAIAAIIEQLRELLDSPL